MDLASIVSVSKTRGNSTWPIFQSCITCNCCFILCILTFYVSAADAQQLIKFLRCLQRLLSGFMGSIRFVFWSGLQTYLLDVSSLSLFKCTEPTHARPQSKCTYMLGHDQCRVYCCLENMNVLTYSMM